MRMEKEELMAKKYQVIYAEPPCGHYEIISVEDGIEVGRCKKCGRVKYYSKAPVMKQQKTRAHPGYHRLPYVIDDAEGSFSNGIKVLEQ